MKNYAAYSFWLQMAGDLTPRPALPGPVTVDVAVLGAGFTGLWTAYYLLQADPALRVAIVEQEIAGFGASGRNGGWCSSAFPVSPGMLEKRYGRDATLALLRAMRSSVDEIGHVCREEGIDADYVKGGCLRVARGVQQEKSLLDSHAVYLALGLGDHYRLLSAQKTRERVRIHEARCSLFTPDCATIQPARLVRGLARAVEQRGAQIFERTEVTGFSPGQRPRLHTEAGDVEARTVVLAAEAYLTRLREFHRRLLPLYSLIVLTEPLSENDWQAIGWGGHECISSMRYTVDYLSKTADGRILFGSRGAPYHWGSRIDDSFDRHQPTHEMIKRLVVDWFPILRDIGFAATWGGPVGMPRDWMPSIRYSPQTGIAVAGGYTGQGVATSNLAGQILADLITGRQSELAALPPVGHVSPHWEPEPLRWLAVRYAQWAYEAVDRRAERTGRPPSGKSLIERLGAH